MTAGQLYIKFIAKGLQVDVGGIDMLIKLCAWFRADITRGHGDGFNSFIMTGPGDIDGIFMKDNRIIVGKGNRAAACELSGKCNLLRAGMVCEGIGFT